MELDELKKSWSALNEHLEKEPIANEEQVKKLIVTYKTNAHKSLSRLTGWQRFSIGIGIVGISIVLIIGLLPSLLHISEEIKQKVEALIIFVGVSLLAGMWWDYKNYCWIRDTKIDEMSVAIVSKRMASFRQWMKYEVIAISIWILVFNILYYFTMEFYNKSLAAQAILIGTFILSDVIIIYLLYKKVAYKHLDSIKKNIDDLKDICAE